MGLYKVPSSPDCKMTPRIKDYSSLGEIFLIVFITG